MAANEDQKRSSLAAALLAENLAIRAAAARSGSLVKN
jgi:hypothetical protein